MARVRERREQERREEEEQTRLEEQAALLLKQQQIQATGEQRLLTLTNEGIQRSTTCYVLLSSVSQEFRLFKNYQGNFLVPQVQ